MVKNMKSKSLIIALIVLLISISLATRITPPVHAQPTRIYVDPPTSTAAPGEYFSVDIKIADASGVAAWEVSLKFNTEVLYTHVDNITEGTFLSSFGLTSFSKSYDPFAGATFGAFVMEDVSASGDGTLATVQFRVESQGQSALDLYDTSLYDSDVNPLTHSVEDGTFYTPNPKADFIYYPYPESWSGRSPPPYRNPVVDETVTFNATYDPPTGTGSLDPDGTIVNYAWDFGDGSTISGPDPVVTHAYTAADNYNVNLTVTDDASLTGSVVKPLTIDIHDIAVTDIQIIGQVVVRPGALVTINITVTNQGTVNEYFNASAYYDDNPIWYNETQNQRDFCLPIEIDPVTGLPPAPALGPDSSITLSFLWNTTNLAEGTYTLKANASLVDVNNPSQQKTGETDTADNTKTDGTITLSLDVPVASFTFSPATPMINENINFNGSASSDEPPGNIVSYEWDFDDGTTDTGVAVTHAYTTAGTYSVTLNVTDNDGQSATHTEDVTVGKMNSLISISASPTTITFGGNITIEGTITPTLAEQNVTIRFKVQDETWNTLTESAQTNQSSQYTYSWAPATAGTYDLRASWLGDANTLGAASEIVSVTVNQRSSTIQIDVSPDAVVQGENVTITGTLSPLLSNVTITIRYKIEGEEWGNLSTVYTDSNSSFLYVWQTSEPGTYNIKASWLGDANTLPAESSVKSLSVEASQGLMSPLFVYLLVAGAGVVIIVALVIFLKLRKH